MRQIREIPLRQQEQGALRRHRPDRSTPSAPGRSHRISCPSGQAKRDPYCRCRATSVDRGSRCRPPPAHAGPQPKSKCVPVSCPRSSRTVLQSSSHHCLCPCRFPSRSIRYGSSLRGIASDRTGTARVPSVFGFVVCAMDVRNVDLLCDMDDIMDMCRPLRNNGLLPFTLCSSNSIRILIMRLR